MEIKIPIQPFVVPDRVYELSKPGLKQEGLREVSSWPLSGLSNDTLSELCDQFRHDVFMKAGKVDPREFEVTVGNKG